MSSQYSTKLITLIYKTSTLSQNLVDVLHLTWVSLAVTVRSRRQRASHQTDCGRCQTTRDCRVWTGTCHYMSLWLQASHQRDCARQPETVLCGQVPPTCHYMSLWLPASQQASIYRYTNTSVNFWLSVSGRLTQSRMTVAQLHIIFFLSFQNILVTSVLEWLSHLLSSFHVKLSPEKKWRST